MAHYVFSDLHGIYPLWEAIKKFISSSDLVYCLGDCADRGPDGWKIIKEVIDTPNIIYIRGNHEQFIIDEDYYLWSCNGGAPTIEASREDTEEEWKRIRDFLKQTPYIIDYTSAAGYKITLCHAGFDPEYIRYADDEALLWDRKHLGYKWPQEWDDLIIIHGHTPIQYMREFVRLEDPRPQLSQAYWYADGHKCCIDQGSFMSDEALLLDLDTFEEIVFSISGDKVEVKRGRKHEL